MGIYRGFPTLAQDTITIGSKGRVSIPANPMARLNAEFERITGGPPPGVGTKMFRAHNHALDGGAVLGRGTIFSCDMGALANGGKFRHVINVAATWESMLGAGSREYIFRANPTKGLTGTLACVLACRSYGAAIEIRISNLDTGTQSSAITTAASSAAQRGDIGDVPFLAGQENRFDIEIKGGEAEYLDILGLCLYEDTSTHPASNGTTAYSSL